ncbi:MAG: C45 family peptidase [Candidatus Bathyarchaeia archaeon]
MSRFDRIYGIGALALNRALEPLGFNWSAYFHKPRIIFSGIVELEGSPFQRGLVHGKLFESVIADLVQRSSLRDQLAKANPELIENCRNQLLRFYLSRFPQIVKEIEGIATGAGLPFTEVFNYNIQPILLLDLSQSECTSVWLRSSNEEIIHAGSQDSGLADGSYLVKRVHGDRQSYVGGMVVGTTWTPFGMNTSGLTIGGASVNSCKVPVLPSQQQVFEGLDVSAFMSVLLDSASTVEQAQQLLNDVPAILPWNSGSNLIISDAKGKVVRVEVCGDKHSYETARGNPFFCTNHFIADEMRRWNRHDTPLVENLHRASVARYETIRTQFEVKNRRDLDGVLELLTWHKQPGAVCRHYRRNGELGQTTVSYVMLPSKKTMYYWIGNPCAHKRRQIILE